MSVSTKPYKTTAWRSGPERTKLVVNNTNGVNEEIKVNGQKPETVTGFKFTWAQLYLTRVPSLRSVSYTHLTLPTNAEV